MNIATGMRQGHLTCLEELPSRLMNDGRKYPFLKVKCDCGNIAEVRKSVFANKQIKYCGYNCGIKKRKNEHYIGKKFGDYTIIELVHKSKPEKGKGQLIKVQCECGNVKDMQLSMLVNGYSQRCIKCSNRSKRKIVPIGTRFDRWVVNNLFVDEKGITKVDCQCDCGTQRTIVLHNLTRKSRNKKTEFSCGCAKKMNLVGQTFGKLTVIREDEPVRKITSTNKTTIKRVWVCTCTCGTEGKLVKQNELLTGQTKSCGCLMSSEERSKRVKGDKNPMYGMRGERNPAWKPERTHEQRVKERKDHRYYEWRKAVYQRDGYHCKCCGDDKGGNLVAHHVYNYADFPTVRYHVGNGITLCTTCHSGFHSVYGKSLNTGQQLEEYLNACTKKETFLSIEEILETSVAIADGESRIKPYTVQYPCGKQEEFYTYEEIRSKVGISITGSLRSVLHKEPYTKRKIVAIKNGKKEKEFASFQEAARYYGCSGTTITTYIGKPYNEQKYKILKGVQFQEVMESYIIARKDESDFQNYKREKTS